MKIALHRLAHTRTGDKGDVSMISVIAYRPQDYPFLAQELTPALVAAHFSALALTKIERFELPALGALNFVLHGALRGGVTRSLALDAHGKTLGHVLLALELEVEDS
jgi:hypothetical protein